ncbi:hypothetical protein Ga0100230_000420 [Opitutaceae bacterium TAV3]|nr:hypothetical protein Ga0100230_000420 [Opitutaceae bacterium TAV3]
MGHDPAAAAHPAAALLDSCYLADDLHTFLDYWQTTPDFPFLAIATRKGEIVDRRGLVTGGYSKKPGNSIVQREIDLRETARQLAEDQKQHDDQRAHIDAINARLADAEATIEQKRHEVLEASQTHAAAQAEQRTAERALEEILTRLNRMENELQAVEAARHETQARFERARQGLIEGEQAVEAGRVRIHEMETRITELRTDRDVKRETLGQARLELAERRQKVEVLDRGLSDMERRRAQLTEIVIQRQQEIETWTDQITQLETETDAQRARVAQLAETLLISQQQVEQIRNELTDIERAINAVENSQEGIRTDAEKSIGELNRCEIELSQNKSRAQFIEEDVQREYQIRVGTYDWRAMIYRHDDDPPDLKTLDLDDEEDDDQPETTDTNNGLNSGAGVPPASEIASAADVPPASDESSPPPPPSRRRRRRGPKPEPTDKDLETIAAAHTGPAATSAWQTVKAEIDALRQRLAGMGAVNTGAIEEYAELKQRYDFLRAQSTDLTNAKADLLKTIDEINNTSMQQFQITFDQIRKNFIYTFQTLFGGGVANLELIATDDVLESGIEITAQPPGTKLKSISLLSGGQKTLTAVGLLFALYMVKPSPFCLLDELDAPLDESNIGRFTDLLKRFINESQFIIITHNKRTVAASHAIYGVTMEERGVSKTVSMKFNHLRADVEPQPENIAEAVRGAKTTVA